MTQDAAKEVKARLSFTTSLDETVKAADYIIEAVPEIPSLKLQLFSDLGQKAEKHTILATNTSSIGITKIAAAAKGAEDRVIGLHFMVSHIL